ncbi:Hypothetical protein D9617_5g069590 [Elsinoe fawcettii]|nr:Hypothetical protein D9617_5g069590 [Elsinoe fawcettii]
MTTSAATHPAPDLPNSSFWSRVYTLSSPSENQALYDEWANTFDASVLDPSQEYVAPALAVSALLKAHGVPTGPVLDAGCGTGLVGVALAQAGVKIVDGLDYSNGMLGKPRERGVYRGLEQADLTKGIEKGEGVYDALVCVGTLTKGHVGPVPALREFVRVVKKGGVVVATVLEAIWEEGGYRAEVERLEREEGVEVVGTDSMDYRKAQELKGRMVVLRKR